MAGRVLSEAESSAQVELDSGKRVKVKAANFLLRFEKPAPAALFASAQAIAQGIELEMAWEFAPDEEFGFAELARDYFSASAPAVPTVSFMSHLQLDPTQIARARASAQRIARAVFDDMSRFTTTTVERATVRLLGVDGVDENGVPLPNRLVEHMQAQGLLQHGAATLLAAAMQERSYTAQQVAETVAAGTLALQKPQNEDAGRAAAQTLAQATDKPFNRPKASIAPLSSH